MRQRWGLIALVAIISFFSGGWLLQRGIASDGNVYQQARLFDDVLSHVSNYYVDSIGESELYQRASDGLLASLKDPYSVLLKDDNYRALQETTSGNYGGLGIQIDVRDGWITVVAPLPDTPAERAGIQTGDQIIEVDSVSTKGWTSERAVKALRGDEGTKIRIQIQRTGIPSPIVYTLTRARIHVRSVPPGTLFDNGVGYISLNPVSETSAPELSAEVAAMQEKGMKAMILDLRGNPGGLLDQGVKVADLFLDPGQEIVATRGRARGSSKIFSDEARQRWPSLPIVTLVNDGSASAAEIIAGALQDHDRSVLVGVPTFGKGLVQTLFPIADDVALKLTTARWYTPSGRTIQRTAKDEQDQARQAADDAMGKASVDSVQHPVFHTDKGRVVQGGGGIVPDLIVHPDTFAAAEKDLVEAVGSHFGDFRDVLTGYALELKNDKSITTERFSVTPAMRQTVLTRLRARGVKISDETYTAAASLIDEQLGYEIARYVFGRTAEFRRRSLDDHQLQTALQLLRKAQTPAQLLSLATARAAEASPRD